MACATGDGRFDFGFAAGTEEGLVGNEAAGFAEAEVAETVAFVLSAGEGLVTGF